MGFCLPKEFANKFIQALKDGRINPDKMAKMSSEERRTFFKDIVGEKDAVEVNSLFESKLLLKDQKTGLVTWAKQISGITEGVRKDLISRIEKMDRVLTPASERAFLEDLAGQKLGTKVTFEEAKIIAEQSAHLQELKGNWDATKAEAELNVDPMNKNAGWKSEADRLAYGFELSGFRQLVGDLKNTKRKFDIRDIYRHPVETAKRAAYGTLGLTKSVLSSLDNSFYGRQGIKVLYTHPTVWVKGFLKSWSDIGKTIIGKDAMRLIEADVLSRPNALNGNYQRMSLDVGINFEEAFPTSIQERLPVIGRAFRAAETAFNGGAMRMRADLADLMIPKAEEFGLSMKNPKDARGVGRLVNSMTGRGYIGGASGNALNVTFFSAKFLKSNIDTLTGHTLWQGDISPEGMSFLRRQAAANIFKIAGTMAFIMATVNALNPNATSLDPRQSSKFGKIKVGDTTIDFTGGMGSLVSLASRMVPTMHNGKWSFWTVNSKGVYTDLLAGKYGQQDAFDVLMDFAAGKLSPMAGVLRDIWKGQRFDGESPTVLNEASGVLTPLPLQTYQDLKKNPNAAPLLLGMMADALGFSTYTPPPKK